MEDGQYSKLQDKAKGTLSNALYKVIVTLVSLLFQYKCGHDGISEPCGQRKENNRQNNISLHSRTGGIATSTILPFSIQAFVDFQILNSNIAHHFIRQPYCSDSCGIVISKIM